MNYKQIVLSTLGWSALFLIPAPRNLAIAQPDSDRHIPQINPQPSPSNKSNGMATPGKYNYSQDIKHIVLGHRIVTRFVPKNSQGEPIELHQLASELGYDHFNWVNYVEEDPHGIADITGKTLITPYNDPPKGGYIYDSADKFPFYWDVEECDRCKHRHHLRNYNNLKQFELVFEDAPADYRLQPGEAVEFITHLVGVKNINLRNSQAEWDILHTFRWKLTNPQPHQSQVSLVEADVDLDRLSPVLLNTMLLDGATLRK